jgi:hypothetical protein
MDSSGKNEIAAHPGFFYIHSAPLFFWKYTYAKMSHKDASGASPFQIS